MTTKRQILTALQLLQTMEPKDHNTNRKKNHFGVYEVRGGVTTRLPDEERWSDESDC